ncbi:uncharacterized protein LOC113279473 [Papaver somniferum]|uniref:uncharacterized protein LOC113279473 n=1 Tax=Papaver somniferum TaxID=3469 RepID=UPI000E6FF1C0|nr:uncharacterized protein LOC113279473 [Papaver somniferum]
MHQPLTSHAHFHLQLQLQSPPLTNSHLLKLDHQPAAHSHDSHHVTVVKAPPTPLQFNPSIQTGGEVTAGMNNLNRFISRHHLIDLPLVGATYTWTNNQIQSVRSRIDGILLSPEWEHVHPDVIQQDLARPCSDHNPISLNCQGLKHGNPPLRCEYFWFSHPNFLNLVKDLWLSFSVSGSAGFIFCKKLQMLKVKRREWSKLEYGEVDRRLEELEDLFMTLDAAEDTNNGITEARWEERTTAKQEYCKLTFINAEKLRSMTRVTHIKDYENNTKYFHRLANDRRRISYIVSIKVDGSLTTDEAEIKEDFLNIMSELQNRGFLDWRLKNTFIALIPKKDTIEEIKDLRPISLIHGVYKIMSKVLSERFKLPLPRIIPQQQSAFVKKRQILDGVLIANELIDSRLRSGKSGILCKIDFEKSFDHVNWDFLEEIFILMGFGDKWRRWIRCCVEYVKFSVLINGSATGFFISKKGIRQGDPISHFLFLLVGEALTFMIKKAQEEGIISGFQIKNDGMLISHLQFADDTLIFLDADVEQVKSLRLILISFEMLTGLKINFAKSQIYGVGYEVVLSPTTYLGLPLGDRCGGVSKWDKIIEKFILKLAGWKKPLFQEMIEKIMKDFLWHDNKGTRKLHLVKWLALTRKKKAGGLGIKILKKLNHALLTKWSWRYVVEDNALWRQIVEEKYNSGDVAGASKVPTSTYGKAKNMTAAEVGTLVDNEVVWNLHIPRRLTAAVRVELRLLTADLHNVRFIYNQVDELQWSLTKNHKFSVSSVYEILTEQDTSLPSGPIFNFIWKLKCPPKIGFFLWLLAYNRMPTIDLLRRRNIDVPADFLFCNETESSSHLLLHCSFARQIWSHFMRHINWFFSMPADIVSMLHFWVLVQSNNVVNAVWNLIPAAIMWSIWKERNARAFSDKRSNARSVSNKEIYNLFSWSLDLKDFENVGSAEVMKNWYNIYFNSS